MNNDPGGELTGSTGASDPNSLINGIVGNIGNLGSTASGILNALRGQSATAAKGTSTASGSGVNWLPLALGAGAILLLVVFISRR